MRGKRLIFISILAIFMAIGISLGSARALDFIDWENTWHKIKVQIKAVCEEDTSQELFKESDKISAWIYIDTYSGADGEFDAFLISLEENGDWQATPITLSISLGTADDAIIESNDDITIVDSTTGEEIEVFFIVRLTGKEKKGALKSGKLKSVAGIATLILTEGECIASLQFSGTLKKEEKVPDEVKNTIP